MEHVCWSSMVVCGSFFFPCIETSVHPSVDRLFMDGRTDVLFNGRAAAQARNQDFPFTSLCVCVDQFVGSCLS